MLIQVVLFVNFINLFQHMCFITLVKIQPVVKERQIQPPYLTNIMHPEHSTEVSCSSHSVQKSACLCPQESYYYNVDLDAKYELCFPARSLGKGPFRAVRHRTEKLELLCSNYRFTLGPARILVSLLMFSNKETRPPR